MAVSSPTYEQINTKEKVDAYASKTNHEDLHLDQFSHHFEPENADLARVLVHEVGVVLELLFRAPRRSLPVAGGIGGLRHHLRLRLID